MVQNAPTMSGCARSCLDGTFGPSGRGESLCYPARSRSDTCGAGSTATASGCAMPRRTFDLILTAVGGVLAVGLLIAGGLLTWGYHFANSTVHDQLAAEQI